MPISFSKFHGFFRTIMLASATALLGFGGAREHLVNIDTGAALLAEAATSATILKGTVANAQSKELVLIHGNDRRKVALDANGAFSCSLELQAPAYVELGFEFLNNAQMKVYLLPGQTLSLTCDAADLWGKARFTGGAAAENNGLILLQARFNQVDYGQLKASNPADFLESLRSHQRKLEMVLSDYSRSHSGLDPYFLKMEKARITYWGAGVRLWRLGFGGDWEAYASGLDLNDPSLLDFDAYSDFLHWYVMIKGKERIGSDPALKTSVNLHTEAQYAVAMKTFTSPVVRNAVLYKILLIQLAGDPNMDWGPLGCKGIEGLMARFDRDCTDEALREDIDRRYRQCRDGRNAPVIRVYKTAGTTTLDAHIFPAAGAKSGEKRTAFLFFHGGGWAIGMPEWGYRQCRRYAEKGLVGISFEYRTRWRHGATPLECAADAKSAVRWVRAHAGELGVDPDRIAVAGFSAGGHLAAVTGILSGCDDPGDDKAVSAVPNAMILMSAAVDVTVDSYVREMLAGHGDPADCSPAQHVRAGLPPTLVFHGLEDPLCGFSLTEAFCKNMKTAGNRCELSTFKGGHFRSAADWAVIDEKIDEFLKSLGFFEVNPLR